MKRSPSPAAPAASARCSSTQLRKRGDEVTVLSRSSGDVRWDPMAGPAPAEALAGRDAVVHLAGEDIAQRWNDERCRRIRESREIGTRNLVAGIARRRPAPEGADLGRRPSATTATAPTRSTRTPRPATTSSPRSARPGSARPRRPTSSASASCACAPASCSTATAARCRRCCCRSGSASAARSPAGTSRCRGSTSTTSSASTSPRSTTSAGAARSTPPRPQPVSNREFSKALGRALHRPAIVPVPALRAQASSTAAWPSSSSRARTPSPAAPSSSGTATGTPTSTRRCAPRLGHARRRSSLTTAQRSLVKCRG